MPGKRQLSEQAAAYLRDVPREFMKQRLNLLMRREGRHKPLKYYLAAIHREWELQHHVPEGSRRGSTANPTAMAEILREMQQT